MKPLGLLAAGIVVSVAAVACGAERVESNRHQVDAVTLSQMGLGGLEVMSDAQGREIRGSFVRVGSFSFALGDVDSALGASSGAPRLRATSASNTVGIPGVFSYSASSRGFAFGFAF